MQINKKVDYSLILIRALKDTFKSGEFVALGEISESHGLPYAFLEKLAGKVKQAGILESQIGKNGGYRLIRDPKKISIGEVINVFQPKQSTRCGSCYIANTCPSKTDLIKINLAINKALNKLTISNL